MISYINIIYEDVHDNKSRKGFICENQKSLREPPPSLNEILIIIKSIIVNHKRVILYSIPDMSVRENCLVLTIV